MRLLSGALLLVSAGLAPAGAADLGAVHDWLRLPERETLGEVSGVAVNDQGEVFAFHRGNRRWSGSPAQAGSIPGTAVWRIDGKTGRVLARWGADTFLLPHGVFVDYRGHVWLTDVGLHQVFEYTADGNRLRSWGVAQAGGSDRSHFNKPTDVAVLPDGSFYVSDGYVNSRVVKFGADGKYLFEWGTKGKGPGEFYLPHGIAVDAGGRVYVADRQNDRIQVFTPEGKYITEWKSPEIGRPYGIRIGPDHLLYVADGGEQSKVPPFRSKLCVITLEGQFVASYGSWGEDSGQFRLAHGVAVARDGAIYVAEVAGRRVQKIEWQR